MEWSGMPTLWERNVYWPSSDSAVDWLIDWLNIFLQAQSTMSSDLRALQFVFSYRFGQTLILSYHRTIIVGFPWGHFYFCLKRSKNLKGFNQKGYVYTEAKENKYWKIMCMYKSWHIKFQILSQSLISFR